MKTLVASALAVAAIGRSDDGFIIEGVGVLGRCYAPSRKREEYGKRGNDADAEKYRSGHKIPLIICVQHSKAVTGDHDLNPAGDAIVIGSGCFGKNVR